MCRTARAQRRAVRLAVLGIYVAWTILTWFCFACVPRLTRATCMKQCTSMHESSPREKRRLGVTSCVTSEKVVMLETSGETVADCPSARSPCRYGKLIYDKLGSEEEVRAPRRCHTLTIVRVVAAAALARIRASVLITSAFLRLVRLVPFPFRRRSFLS